jgi:large subunit ribosomal protein L18
MSSRNEIRKKSARRVRRRFHVRRSTFGTSQRPRLTVFRSHKNISCQLIDDAKGVTLASASTQAKDAKGVIQGSGGNVKAAAAIGKLIAEKVKALGVSAVQFDRNGYRFHGRIKALVNAAREAGLKI